MFKNPFKKEKTSIAEIEAIANRKGMVALIQSASTRTAQESEVHLESSRLIKGRVAKLDRNNVKAVKSRGWLARKLRSWLGVDELELARSSDLVFMAERFKYTGDVVAKYGANWHGSLLLLQAQELDDIARDIGGSDGEDFADAAKSIRQLSVMFIDKIENINDNKTTEVTAT